MGAQGHGHDDTVFHSVQVESPAAVGGAAWLPERAGNNLQRLLPDHRVQRFHINARRGVRSHPVA